MAKPALVLHKETKATVATKPIFIDADLHEQLVGIKQETGIPLRQIVNKFIHYGLDNVEIHEDESTEV